MLACTALLTRGLLACYVVPIRNLSNTRTYSPGLADETFDCSGYLDESDDDDDDDEDSSFSSSSSSGLAAGIIAVIVISVLLAFGLPLVIVVCFCIAAAKASQNRVGMNTTYGRPGIAVTTTSGYAGSTATTYGTSRPIQPTTGNTAGLSNNYNTQYASPFATKTTTDAAYPPPPAPTMPAAPAAPPPTYNSMYGASGTGSTAAPGPFTYNAPQ